VLCTKLLIDIFDALYSTFGPQHWWPAKSDFEVIVGAILTQSVSWVNVEKAIRNLKKESLLSIDAILEADEKSLAGLIKSTRFYNQKAAKLKNFCNYIKTRYTGDIYEMFKNDVLKIRQELLSIKGLGAETADSIILYAAKKPIFVVDSYTKRVFFRMGFFDDSIDYQSMQDFFMKHLPKDTKLYNEYHALIVKLGKDYCLSRQPKCEVCPLNDHFCTSKHNIQIMLKST
jgi:endonuclease-3 related protein